MRACLLVLLFQGVWVTACASVPSGYYAPIDGLRSASLKSALSSLLLDHKTLDYDSLWSAFTVTDTHTDGTPWDMYSDKQQNNFWGMNREHAFPKSWWGGAINAAYTDLHHLFPADEAANLAKGNHPLGVVAIPLFDNGLSLVGYDSFQDSSTETLVFEPADTYKGDFARAYFYVATCYQDYEWKHTFMVESNAYPTLRPEAVNLLLDWHRKDPVSDKERNRNDVVYTLQYNRNPFVDYPELAAYLWGDSTAYAFSLKGKEGNHPSKQHVQFYTEQHSLFVRAYRPGLTIAVYHPSGIRRLILTSTGEWQQLDTLAPGVYLVTCSGRVWKVLLN